MNAIEERRSIGGIEHGQSPAQLGGGLVKAEWGNQHLGEAVADPRSPFGDGLVDRRPTSSGSNRFAIDSPLEGEGFEPSVPPAKVSSVFAPRTRSGPRTPGYTSAQELQVSARFVLLGEPF